MATGLAELFTLWKAKGIWIHRTDLVGDLEETLLAYELMGWDYLAFVQPHGNAGAVYSDRICPRALLCDRHHKSEGRYGRVMRCEIKPPDAAHEVKARLDEPDTVVRLSKGWGTLAGVEQ